MKEIEYDKLAKAMLTDDSYGVDSFIREYIISNIDLDWSKIAGHKKDYTLQMKLIEIIDTLNNYIPTLNGAFDFNVYDDILELDIYYDYEDENIKILKMNMKIEKEEIENAGQARAR